MLKFLKRKILKPGPKYSWKKALWIITLSCCMVAGCCTAYVFLKAQRAKNALGTVLTIVQTGPEYAPLQTSYLAEILNLSTNCATHLGQLDLEEAYERLYASHVIKKAQLKKIKPHTLFIDYTIREPIAYLEDYTNTALDDQGFLFPFLPFYAPTSLPRIYLGSLMPTTPWGETLQRRHFDIAHFILNFLGAEKIKRIDLSHVDPPFLGKREIVVVLQNGSFLRLNPKNYTEQLDRFLILENVLLQEDATNYIVDLRLLEVAYLQPLL